MSAPRKELEDKLCKYGSDTFRYIQNVINFTDRSSEWIKEQEEEKCALANIAETANDIRNRFSQVKKSKNKAEAFVEMAGDYMVPGQISKKQAEEEKMLQIELNSTIDKILNGLKEILPFSVAVEKLAVTSVPMFEQNDVVQLSAGTDQESVKKILLAAHVLCPLLILFKRNNKVFFEAKLHNVEVMASQLNQYIGLIRHICGAFKKCFVADLCLKEHTVFLKHDDITEEEGERLLTNIKTLDQIRENKDFRMVFLFQDEYSAFMEKFSEKKERMQTFLKDLEPCAVQLDQMNKGARISNVVGSSVGVVAGGLSIAGLALIPFTAGASLGLIIAGAATAGTSVANSIVTTVTESAVSKHQKNKANKKFEEFMKDMNDLQNCLNQAINHHLESKENDEMFNYLKMAGKGVGGIKCIDAIVDGISVIKVMGAEKATVESEKVLAQAALRGPLAMSKLARGGFIAMNALFIGVDILVIANEGMSLSQGTETEASKWIRARAALWKSEVRSLQKIYDSLEKGQKYFEKKQLLQNPF